MSKKTIYSAVKWLFAIAAFLHLAYKLAAFNQYDEFMLQWRQTPAIRLWLPAGAIALLPVNLALESIKWMRITFHLQALTFAQSLKGVLAGITTGFFTPNRIGDLLGRIAFLHPRNRTAGVTLSLLNSLAQNFTIMLCGIPACVLLFMGSGRADSNLFVYLGLSAGLVIAAGLLYFLLPALSKKLKKTRFGKRINEFTNCLAHYSAADLFMILLVSLLRYVVFSMQFFLLLRFFGVELTAVQALLCIPTNYLFVTFTPSVAFSEAAIRASYAVFTIGMFSTQTAGIALAGVAVWVVNWAVPLAAGSVIVLKSDEPE